MDLKDPNAAVRAEILAIVRAQVRPHITAAIFAELMRSFPGAVDALLERRDAFERGDISPPELITAAIVEELRVALEPPRRRRPRKPPAARPRSARAHRSGRAPEQGSGQPAVTTTKSPAAAAATSEARPPATVAARRPAVKQPATVIDTWSPPPAPVAAASSVPVRRLPAGVFGDQLGPKKPAESPLPDPDGAVEESA